MPSTARSSRRAPAQRQTSRQSAVRRHRLPYTAIAHANTSLPIVIQNNLKFINQAVETFDSRFTLRALRSISTLRKSPNFAEAIVLGIRTAYPKPSRPRQILEELLPKSVQVAQNGSAGKEKEAAEQHVHQEVWAYLGVLVQVSRGREP